MTMPSEKDFANPGVGQYLSKYLQSDAAYAVEERQRVLRLLENLTMGMGAVGYLAESMHGAGSPQAQRIMIGRLADLDEKARMARRLAGIDGD